MSDLSDINLGLECVAYLLCLQWGPNRSTIDLVQCSLPIVSIGAFMAYYVFKFVSLPDDMALT
jgi:hypothetical protein